MAIRFTIGAKDVASAKLVKPGWYSLKVESVKEEGSKNGDWNNVIVELVGLNGDAKGVPFRRTFPETYPQFAIEFLRSCGANIPEEGATVDFESANGKVIDGLVINDKDDKGKLRNGLDGFAPAGTKVKAEAESSEATA